MFGDSVFFEYANASVASRFRITCFCPSSGSEYNLTRTEINSEELANWQEAFSFSAKYQS